MTAPAADRIRREKNIEVRRNAIERNMPAIFDDPVQATGWTYGIPGTRYRTLARRA